VTQTAGIFPADPGREVALHLCGNLLVAAGDLQLDDGAPAVYGKRKNKRGRPKPSAFIIPPPV